MLPAIPVWAFPASPFPGTPVSPSPSPLSDASPPHPTRVPDRYMLISRAWEAPLCLIAAGGLGGGKWGGRGGRAEDASDLALRGSDPRPRRPRVTGSRCGSRRAGGRGGRGVAGRYGGALGGVRERGSPPRPAARSPAQAGAAISVLITAPPPWGPPAPAPAPLIAPSQ